MTRPRERCEVLDLKGKASCPYPAVWLVEAPVVGTRPHWLSCSRHLARVSDDVIEAYGSPALVDVWPHKRARLRIVE